MKTLILQNLASNVVTYERGDTPDLDENDAQRLINAGLALPAIELDSVLDEIELAALAAGYTAATVEPGDVLPSGSLIGPSGSYFWQDGLLNLIHPSGQHVALNPLHLIPNARP